MTLCQLRENFQGHTFPGNCPCHAASAINLQSTLPGLTATSHMTHRFVDLRQLLKVQLRVFLQHVNLVQPCHDLFDFLGLQVKRANQQLMVLLSQATFTLCFWVLHVYVTTGNIVN